MIIGNGDIASILPNRKDLLFFASGVSNSQETRASEYRREVELLKEVRLSFPRGTHVVYFSSLGVLNGTSRYYKHKRTMEDLVKEFFPLYTIVRIGNITFGSNPHTLINYLKAHPEAEIKDEWRYIVDEDELLHWISLIPSFPCEMNIPGKRLKVKQVKELYV